MFAVIVAGLSLVVAPLFAAAPFVGPLLSVSLSLSISAVAAISFPAFLLSAAFMLPVPTSTPAWPLGLPLVPVPFPVLLVSFVIGFPLALLVPGLLSLRAPVFMMLPLLPPVLVVATVSLFVPALALFVPAATAASPALSPLLVPVCAAGPPPFPVPSVPIAISAFPLFPLTVALPLQLAVEAGTVAFFLVMVAPAPRPPG